MVVLIPSWFVFLQGIVFGACLAHDTLDLLVEDLFELQWVAPLLERAKEVRTLVSNHDLLRADLKHTHETTLVSFAETRFFTNFLMIL